VCVRARVCVFVTASGFVCEIVKLTPMQFSNQVINNYKVCL